MYSPLFAHNFQPAVVYRLLQSTVSPTSVCMQLLTATLRRPRAIRWALLRMSSYET